MERLVSLQKKLGSAVMATVLLCLAPGLLHAAQVRQTVPAALLVEADKAKTGDHDRFLDALKQLHGLEDRLSPAQREHLRFLDAWQTAYAGDYARANELLHDIISHDTDASLSVRAKALLMHDNFVERHYEEAYGLANTLMADLPGISNATVRIDVLSQMIQLLNRVRQYDLALEYVRQMKAAFPTGKGQCLAMALETQTMIYQGGKLTSADPAFSRAIDTCLAASQLVVANALRVDWADLMNDEGHPDQAITLLQAATPDILKAGYRFHIAEMHMVMARAYLRMGNDGHARTAALQTLAANKSGNFNETLEGAYEVLYRVEHQARHDAEALDYYEKYVAQYKASTEDDQALALAYQMVKQEVQAKKMKLDALAKQNRILQLQQALDRKSAETSRLYIVLLLLVIAFIAIWMYRLKHSQLRFRQMARHDGLTETFNRLHFLDEATRALQRLQKANAGACLVLLDLDHFKEVNDTYGHAAGDKVLKCTAAIARGELRESDIFGRLGGEEFGILMPACTLDEGAAAATRIRRALATTPTIIDPDTRITVSASFGLACTRTSGYALTRLLTDADAALYRAKRSGRNRLVVDTGDNRTAVPA
jgi:diguanylate cyclase (GGDEF)-like protein